jgi:DNA-binding NtrC family response regulator
MTNKRILIIEDDPYISILIENIAKKFGSIHKASSLMEATSYLTKEHYDLALVDLNLGKNEEEGFQVLQICQNRSLPAFVISSQDSFEITKKVYQFKAMNFLEKGQIKNSLEPYLEKFFLSFEQNFDLFFKEKFITSDQSLINQIEQLCSINLRDKNVLLTGQSGVGKTLLAKLIHDNNYKDAPFVSFNCAQYPESLIESELFGYKKGAFTGAQTDYKGLFEQVRGGTLFLDEIANMPSSVQQKLLKVLEEKNFRPLGSTQSLKTDFTLIAATWDDLEALSQKGIFRQDLLHRLNGFKLHLPELKYRPQDILKQFQQFQKKSPRRFVIDDECVSILQTYSWPGNTRELKKIVEILAETKAGMIDALTLKNILNSTSDNTEKLLSTYQQQLIEQIGLRDFIKKIEKEMVNKTLLQEEGKVTACIEKLKISASAFYRIAHSDSNPL